MLPLPSTATPYGPLNVADAPGPSTEPATLGRPAILLTWPAAPANVETTPAEVILRMVEFVASTTKTLPLLSTATPVGKLNRAAVPVPSVEPNTPDVPAKVETTPAGVTFLIVLLPASAT